MLYRMLCDVPCSLVRPFPDPLTHLLHCFLQPRAPAPRFVHVGGRQGRRLFRLWIVFLLWCVPRFYITPPGCLLPQVLVSPLYHVRSCHSRVVAAGLILYAPLTEFLLPPIIIRISASCSGAIRFPFPLLYFNVPE